MNEIPFVEFRKIPRLSRDIIISEKIDGSSGCIYIGEDGTFLTGSRHQWITPEKDNFGFSRWCHQNKDELMKLGVGLHFGEYYGVGIQRGYHLSERRFALFNTNKWSDPVVRPKCCEVVKILYEGEFKTPAIDDVLFELKTTGSKSVPGYMNPEGIVIYHKASGCYFKKTILNDEKPKGAKNEM